MKLEEEISQIIGQPEGLTLEYKSVLPPSKNIAQLISSFANSNGGYIVLGVTDNFEINGLSEDFHANTIVHKALDLLTPLPHVRYQYVLHKEKKLYVIKVDKSEIPISVEGRIYKRVGSTSILSNPAEVKFKFNAIEKISTFNTQLELIKKDSTNAKIKLIEHYQSILKIIDDLNIVLYPSGAGVITTNQEGKILSRILYSSAVDNFETYLSDLLYEIFLANPSTLKSKQAVTIEEVLNCSDLQEFVKYWAKQKISKLQKGSVKGFISDNQQIKDLKVLDEKMQNEIEKILQIRHLYSHRNGIVDEKFLQYFADKFKLNDEHQMPINEVLDKVIYLLDVAHQIDLKAKFDFKLATGS